MGNKRTIPQYTEPSRHGVGSTGVEAALDALYWRLVEAGGIEIEHEHVEFQMAHCIRRLRVLGLTISLRDEHMQIDDKVQGVTVARLKYQGDENANVNVLRAWIAQCEVREDDND